VRIRVAAKAMKRPSRPPAMDMKTLSTSDSKMIRVRLAPSANRTANSRRLDSSLAMRSVVRFAHPIRTTKPVAAKRVRSTERR
jgi:hypothetical protein